MKKELIVGLGNPGRRYYLTRHNLGRVVLCAFAEKYHFSFKKERGVKGEIAQSGWGEGVLFLLFPTLYMNLSGRSVRRTINFYAIALEDILVISDDVSLPLGTCRLRSRGSSGGHNGLKSIEEALNTRNYHRLRLGVGRPLQGGLEEYVLSPFEKEEQEQLSEMIIRGVILLEEWLSRELKGA